MSQFLFSGTSAAATAELQVLHSSTVDYSILECVGEGNFGKVVKCQNLSNNETVAVKIIKEGFEEDLEHEISMLKLISVLDADHTNLLKFYEHFVYMNYNCLVFEILDVDLYTLMENREWEYLSLTEIRSIAEQLLVALDSLKDLGIIHTDIKPDNVMVVSGKIQPLKVKLIDFGLAITTSSMEPGLDIQPLGYRAPEVSIGLPFSEAIDVWGLGCLLTFLYIGENLLSVSCDYQMMKRVSELLGLPKDDQLQAGVHTRSFFCEAEGSPKWRLMTPEEYEAANNIVPEEQQRFVEFSSLDDLVNVHPGEESGEAEDRKAFVDLLKQLLRLDGDERISPCQAQFHHFFTTSHLNQQETSRHYQPSSQVDNTTCPASGEESVLDQACVTESNDASRLAFLCPLTSRLTFLNLLAVRLDFLSPLAVRLDFLSPLIVRLDFLSHLTVRLDHLAANVAACSGSPHQAANVVASYDSPHQAARTQFLAPAWSASGEASRTQFFVPV
ncbi:homeodomain-interacting protein kinase 1-like [Gouania willdenowi]|uniref:homeodomain-interacting protein kinase 1-like n=1 Tax=Gouania willdenowi TaxID=441366 RepID=UPI0010546152|nr:homeodomain-interacting protein kinase 1-like [Gouania willdenowi]